MKNQGFSGRYLFCRPLMVEVEGLVISTRHSPSKSMILPDFCSFLVVFACFSIYFQTAYSSQFSYPRHRKLQVKSITAKTNLSCFIFVFHPLLFCAFRTTAPLVPIIDKSLPFMSLTTYPPYFFIATWQYICGS